MAVDPTTDLPVERFASQAAWEAWLGKHHGSSAGLRLELAKKDSGVPSVTHAEAVESALCYGWIDGQGTTADDPRFWRLRFTPRRRRSKWSRINCAAVERLQAEGRLQPAGLREVEAAKADGRWDAAYASQRTITVPEDLQAELEANPGARRFFEQLDSRNRYAILYRIHDAKKPETRLRRIQKFLRMLEAGETIY
ncbi:MAG: YdeI/OmpD-associated family protein [Gemmatimonadales bacterium]|nr:YdeI/OmpD-associated family protein [Gemmatimonadales bacterium]